MATSSGASGESKKTSSKETKEAELTTEVKPPKCGLVMPISAIDDCTEQHWLDVKSILTQAIDAAGFDAVLVSDADDVGIIQKRIIQNLYQNPIVVCDVSGKNPNVMFELGLRLAFDKPTIIVKDDATSYSFDTAPIEHLEYPRDLRFGKIVTFIASLASKIKGTHEKATSDPAYTTFLKNFGQFHVAKLETTEVSKDDYILEELREMRRLLSRKDSRGGSTIRSMPELSHSSKAFAAARTALDQAMSQLSSEAEREAVRDMVKNIRPADLSLPAISKFYITPSDARECPQDVTNT